MKLWITAIAIVITMACGLIVLQDHTSNQFLSGFLRSGGTVEHQKILIILTQTRSGSSFTGEVFAAAKNSIYFYEPLYPFGYSCKPYSNEKQLLLEQLLQCNFTRLAQLYADGFNKSKSKDGGMCKQHGLCFADVSAGLVNRYHETCTRMKWKFRSSSKECGYPFKSDILAEMCRSSGLLITKIVRMCTVKELEGIYETLTASGKSVYVLHLVRDLRSIMSSNFKISKHKDTEKISKQIVQEYCDRQRSNLNYLKHEFQESKIIREGRYMMLRYEDIATGPVKAATQVFRFMGAPLPKEVVDNIHNHLQPSIPRILRQHQRTKTKAADQVRRIVKQYKNPFGVVRDPKAILNEWREMIPFEAIQYIQEHCRDVMEEFDYVMFSSVSQMKDLSHSSFSTTRSM